MLSWMAWTWPTALVFVGIFSAIAVLIVIEIRSPGGAERRGILGLTTTRIIASQTSTMMAISTWPLSV